MTCNYDLYSVVRVRCYAIILVLVLTIDHDNCVALHLPRIHSNTEVPRNNNQLPVKEATSFSSIVLMNDKASCDRRSIFTKIFFPTATSFLMVQLQQPMLAANAAIDVSGLRQTESRSENSVIVNQIRSYDGSETTRLQEIQKLKATSIASRPSPGQTESVVTATMNNGLVADAEEEVGVATYAYRYSTAFQPRMTKVGNYGEKLRYDDQLFKPSMPGKNGEGFLSVSFEFPSDWLQLDKMLGGIQYVDQRNGDKLYVLKGAILRSGITVDEYKVKTSTILSDGSISIPHRRLLIKYATVTPNGLRTERRAIVDAYEENAVAYMMVTSSNAVKFDANGRERETVEAIADSFRLEKIV